MMSSGGGVVIIQEFIRTKCSMIYDIYNTNHLPFHSNFYVFPDFTFELLVNGIGGRLEWIHTDGS
jgi:hypothetical protein